MTRALIAIASAAFIAGFFIGAACMLAIAGAPEAER